MCSYLTGGFKLIKKRRIILVQGYSKLFLALGEENIVSKKNSHVLLLFIHI